MDIFLPVRIDMFSFDERVRPEVLADVDGGTVRLVDLSRKKESMPIRVVNAVDDEEHPKVRDSGYGVVAKLNIKGRNMKAK